VAQHRPGTARKNGAELAGTLELGGVTEQVDAVEKPVQAPRSQTMIDRVVGQPSVAKLGAGDNAALATCELGDRPLTACWRAVNPDLARLPRAIAGFTAHIAVNPDLGPAAPSNSGFPASPRGPP
jgi:hypothetical protein